MAEYIERTKALRIVDEVHGARSAYQRIRAIPAADVAPVVHGRWLQSAGGWRRCSHCNEEEYLKDFENTNYCPNCGARMDGE